MHKYVKENIIEVLSRISIGLLNVNQKDDDEKRI
jgi:hypothetical protein